MVSDPTLVADSFICQVLDCSDKKIIPTQNFTFTYTVPFNEKWSTGSNNQFNFPEYLIDMSTVYYFDYSELDISNAKQFAQGTPVYITIGCH